MSAIVQELKSKLATLSKEDRLELTFFLLDDLQGEVDPDWVAAWTEELQRREDGPKYAHAEDVFGKYRKSAQSSDQPLTSTCDGLLYFVDVQVPVDEPANGTSTKST
jgi:hypothetical protein